MDPFVLIRQLQGAIGGKTVRSGTTTVTFAASAVSSVATVTHGLGKAPTEIQLTNKAATEFMRLHYDSLTTTTFLVAAKADAALTATVTVSWTASG